MKKDNYTADEVEELLTNSYWNGWNDLKLDALQLVTNRVTSAKTDEERILFTELFNDLTEV